jgi:RNase P/RNase MRP subunit p29
VISKGLYVENLIINKPGLTLKSIKNEGDVIIVASMRPTLTIDLQKGETVTISGLKLTHCGNNEESYFIIY